MLCLKSGRAARECQKPARRGAVSVTRGAESTTYRIMWSVFFLFLSYLDRNFVKGDLQSPALEAGNESKEMFSMQNGTFCVKTSTGGENFLYDVTDGAEMVRTLVSPDGNVVNCSIIVNQMRVKSFMHECRLGLKDQRSGLQVRTRFAHMDEAKLMCQEFKDRMERSGEMEGDDRDDAALQKKVLKRSKRGFTYPGTLWCGAGNMADHFDQLGEFAETDSCCRTHDHCPHVIHAFSSNYGYTNFKWHSICLCDCDDRLKHCLRRVNDTSSRVVGQAFFNVIGVPCFDLAYEERCVERHWYGMCKRYSKVPIAMLREAVPYDFGGIHIIDELPLSPSKEADSKNKDEEGMPESTTQSTMSAPEEPSLRNVVTAAEDFIKVLATVSTSQSTNTDSEKGEAQSSEKKKRKNTGKKKKTAKKHKDKGKGRKRKQKAEDSGVKIEDATAVSSPGSKAEEVNPLSNFIVESHKHDHTSRKPDRVGDSGYELRGIEEPSNEVMKDEPAMDEETVSTTSPVAVQKKPESKGETTHSASRIKTTVRQKVKTRRPKGGGTKKKPSFSHSEQLAIKTANISVHANITTTPLQPQQQSFEIPLLNITRTPIGHPIVERNRSKERGNREGKKKRRKDSLASPIVDTPNENSSADKLTVIPVSGAPTVQSLHTTPPQEVSHRMNIYTGKTIVQAVPLNSSFSIPKRQKLQKEGQRSKRRRTVLPHSSERALLNSSSENVFPVPPTEVDARTNPLPAAAISGPTEETDAHREGEILTTVKMTSPVNTKRHWQTIRQQRKLRKKASPAVLGDGVSLLKQTEQTPMTFTVEPPATSTTEALPLHSSVQNTRTTTETAIMSPVQVSIERVKAQFTRKKRRKAILSIRRH